MRRSVGDIPGEFAIFDQTNASDRLIVTSGDNIGIGTTNPSQALEVNGKVKVDSFASSSDPAPQTAPS